MATTTNYGWTTPNDTDLVKDGAAAIRTLGSSIDTTTKALNPGTTSGDVDYYTAGTTKARLAIGTTGQVLSVSGGVPAWTTLPSADSMTSIATGSLSGSSNISITSISGIYNYLLLSVRGATVASGWGTIIRVNSDSGANYQFSNVMSSTATITNSTAQTSLGVSDGTTTANRQGAWISFPNYASTATTKSITWLGTEGRAQMGVGLWNSSSAITSVQISNGGALNFSGGTYTLWGVK